MRRLLPEIQRLLEFRMALGEQDVHSLYVVDISVLLELLSYFGSDLGDGHIQRIHRLDFRAGSQPFSVGFQDSTVRICPVDGRPRPLRQIGSIDDHVETTALT